MKSPRSFARKLSLSILLLCLLALIVEVASFATFTVAREKFRFLDLGRGILNESEVAHGKELFDARLGWLSHKGERTRTTKFGKPLLATYGDSFTFCSEVDDDALTWQTQLAKRLERDIINWGQGGFGPDQAYLRYLDHGDATPTPLVTLGWTDENIKRIINVYRRFYHSGSGIPLTKPRFELSDGELVLIDNPIKTLADVERLKDYDFVATLGAHDWWFNRNDLPVLGFPYSRFLFHPSIWHDVRLAISGNKPNDSDPAPIYDSTFFWSLKEATDVLSAIADSFSKTAASRGSRAIFYFVPSETMLIHYLRNTSSEYLAGHMLLYRWCAERQYECFDPFPHFAEYVRSSKHGETKSLYMPGGHISPEGNEQFAIAMHDFLVKRNLVALVDRAN